MRKLSKYIFSLIIATGILFSPIPKPTIVYNCTGTEMFPVFFGSPFIYKSSSLATSLAYDFYLIGIVADLILWSLFVLLLRLIVIKTISRYENKWILYTYQRSKYALAVLCIASTILSIYVFCETIKLKADLEGESKVWGMTCKGQLYLNE